jgi:hypothetical protein
VSEPDPTAARERLQRDYRPAFLRYLSRRDEPGRHAGYVLGRAAVGAGQSVLDVVAAHHVALLEVLPEARTPDEVLAMSTAAAEFLTEVLASFSMSGYAAMAEQLEEAQRELTALRTQVTPPAG